MGAKDNICLRLLNPMRCDVHVNNNTFRINRGTQGHNPRTTSSIVFLSTFAIEYREAYVHGCSKVLWPTTSLRNPNKTPLSRFAASMRKTFQILQTSRMIA